MIAAAEPKRLTTDLGEDDGLSDSQRVFKDAYLKCWNATEAARIAKYPNPANTGWRLLRNSNIQACIKTELRNYHIGVDHVLARLSEKANLNLADFLTNGQVDEAKVEAKGYLVKKYKYKRNENLSTEEVSVTNVEIELCDSDQALIFIGRHLHMFQTDTVTNNVVIIADLQRDMAPLLAECLDPAKLEKFAQGMAALASKHGYQPPRIETAASLERTLPPMAEKAVDAVAGNVEPQKEPYTAYNGENGNGEHEPGT